MIISVSKVMNVLYNLCRIYHLQTFTGVSQCLLVCVSDGEPARGCLSKQCIPLLDTTDISSTCVINAQESVSQCTQLT